jgi:hypothetical protein
LFIAHQPANFVGIPISMVHRTFSMCSERAFHIAHGLAAEASQVDEKRESIRYPYFIVFIYAMLQQQLAGIEARDHAFVHSWQELGLHRLSLSRACC